MAERNRQPDGGTQNSDQSVLVALRPGPGDYDELKLSEIISALWRRRLAVILIVLTFTSIAITATFFMTKVYRSQVLLSSAQEERSSPLSDIAGNFSGLASLAGINVGASGSVQEAIAILKSRIFIERFIEDLQILPMIFEDRWDDAAKTWVEDASIEPPTAYEGYQRFTTDVLSVEHDQESGLVTLMIDWHEPTQAAQWANALVNRLNEDTRRKTIDEARQSLQYLYQELENTSIVELRQAIYGLMEQQINAIMLANVRRDFVFKIIDPAVVPNHRDVVRPRRLIIVFAGFLLGAIVALSTALWLEARSAVPSSDQP